MRVFYGAAIQGQADRSERREIHRALIASIKGMDCVLVSEHTGGNSFEETAELLSESLGPLPPLGTERTIYVRDRMIDFVESDIDAAVFEVSVPSLGTGIEIAHAYLRPRLGLSEIPILALYERNYWPNNLSTMIRGLSRDLYPNFIIKEYDHVEEACRHAEQFLSALMKG